MNVGTEGSIILTRNWVKKLVYAIDSQARSMKEDELMQISIINNTILIDTDNVNTIVKLENQS